MLDLPMQSLEKPKTEIEYIVAQATPCAKNCSFSRDTSVADPLYQQAEAIVSVLKNGFNWSDVPAIIKLSFAFVEQQQGLTFDQKKQEVIVLLDHIVDLTETSGLPTHFTTPLFKALIPPLVDLIGHTLMNKFKITPTMTRDVVTPNLFITFADELKATYEDGWQWTDIGSYLHSAVTFASGFISLTEDEQKAAVLDVANAAVDEVKIPHVPTQIVDPVIKAFMPSLINLLFDKVAH